MDTQLDSAPARPFLGAYAAKQCPYRLFRENDPFEAAVATEPDESLQKLFDDGIDFEAAMVAEILALHGDDAVTIPGRSEATHDERRAATDAALAARAPIILGALMQPDVDGRRMAEIDLIVATGRTTEAGKAEYLPVDVKSHRCTVNTDDTEPHRLVAGLSDLVSSANERSSPLTDSPLDALGAVGPASNDTSALAGVEPRYREDDCLQLAHYHRLLQAHGHAEPDGDEVWGGILGREECVAWFDLQRPAFTTLTPQEFDDDGVARIAFHQRNRSTKRTALDRYDFEFGFRLRVIDAARERTSPDEPPIVHPVAVKECDGCVWRDPCRSDLEASGDVSLVKSVQYPQWRVHRFMGNPTVESLASLDLTTARTMNELTKLQLAAARRWAADADPAKLVAESTWPRLAAAGVTTAAALDSLDPATLAYADSPITSSALVKQIKESHCALAGRPLIDPDWNPASIPRGDVEIDLDLENEAFVYLWGARLSVVPEHWPEAAGTYVSYATFDPVVGVEQGWQREAELVRDLWAWLADIIRRADAEGLAVRIYGYAAGSVEGAQLRNIVDRAAVSGLPSRRDVDALIESEMWVDLLPLMQRKYWSNDGHGLKVMAVAAGFAWRDDAPGGFASMAWYEQTVSTDDPTERSANIRRILEYNEDDCAATAALR